MDVTRFFPWLILQQDYLWFLVAFAWAAVFVAWRRFPAAVAEFPWMPWAALGGVSAAALQVSQIITPVELKPWVPPRLAWDLALGGIQALTAIGVGVAAGRKCGWPRLAPFLWIAAAAAAAVARYWHPLTGALALTLMIAAAAFMAGRTSGTVNSTRLTLSALVAAQMLASNGPVAEALGRPHRTQELSVFALIGGLGWLASALAAGWTLYRRTGEDLDSPLRRTDLRLLVRAQAVWISLGVALAAVMSAWARSSFEGNLLSRAVMAAELIDKPELEKKVGPAFRIREFMIERFQGADLLTYRSDFLASDPLPLLAGNLATIELANRDADFAAITTMRGGQLVFLVFSSRYPPAPTPDAGAAYGPPDGATWQAWADKRALILAPLVVPHATVVEARAPLLGTDRRMFGWLTLQMGLAHWLAAQAQARLLAFAVIGLGAALLMVNWQQRIRERVRAADRREADAALAANRVKAAFLAKVSHELRTPIQSLLGYSELLRQRVADDPKAASWLASLQQHGELMTRLVNDLIDLGAIEAGGFSLAARTVSPADIVAQTVESFRPRAEGKALSLASFIDPSTPAWVQLDGERFRQVLTNLVGNALKYTARGGVTVALRAETPQRLVLTVRDTGPGIPPAEQARLFVAFSRLEITADQEGSGLGLALSAALCRAMGGTLSVASDGVAGSTFIAAFAATPAPAPAKGPAADPLSVLRGRRILVVDDNPLVRDLFIAFLTEHGAVCAAAGTAAEALAQAGASEFDAVILDLALPDGDGTTLAPPLRSCTEGARIVGVSAHASSADRERALAAGMDAFLTKPVPLRALAAAVADHRHGPVPLTAEFRTADALRARLARQFSADLPEQRAKLAAAVARRDWPRTRALAHYLKNSAVVVRDDALFDVCTGLELAAAHDDETASLRWWDRCQTELDRWGRESPLSPADP